MISEHVSPVVAALQQVDELAREQIRANAIAKVSAFEKDGKVRVPGVARCIVGTKQDASGTRPRDGARLDVLTSVVHQLRQPDRASQLVEEALMHYRAVGYQEGEASGLQTAGGSIWSVEELPRRPSVFARRSTYACALAIAPGSPRVWRARGCDGRQRRPSRRGCIPWCGVQPAQGHGSATVVEQSINVALDAARWGRVGQGLATWN
jgi:hypothetical protein